MGKRIICITIMVCCVAGIYFFCLEGRSCLASLLVTTDCNSVQGERIQTMLTSDPLVNSFGSYSRSALALLQDEHKRRDMTASLVCVYGDYTPAYAIRLLSGRFLSPEDRDKAVLRADQASWLFCTYDCIGRDVLMDGIRYEVVGVYEPLGLAAHLSILSEPECYVSAGTPQRNWLITLQEGKEAQREFSLSNTLYRYGVRSATIVPLFRSRQLLTFILRMQTALLLCLIVSRVWKQISNSWKSMHERMVYDVTCLLHILVIVFLCAIGMSFPITPSWLPSSFSMTAILDKLRELLLFWNNHINTVTMEQCSFRWVSTLTIVCCMTFWCAFAALYKGGRENRD